MLEHLRDGDEVMVWKLDRLRRTRNLLALVADLERRGVHFRSVADGINTTGPMGRATLTTMSAFAQLERDQVAERTSASTAAAAEHRRKARRREVTAAHAKVRRAVALKAQSLTPADIWKDHRASRATDYRYLSLASDELV